MGAVGQRSVTGCVAKPIPGNEVEIDVGVTSSTRPTGLPGGGAHHPRRYWPFPESECQDGDEGGELLLAIRYASSLPTRDLDFSTRDKYTAESVDLLLAELRERACHCRMTFYNTLCRLQSHKVEPKGENKTHQNAPGLENRVHEPEQCRANEQSLEAGTSFRWCRN